MKQKDSILKTSSIYFRLALSILIAIFLLSSCQKDDELDNENLTSNKMLYIAYQDLTILKTSGVPGSHFIEIKEWENEGYKIDFLSNLPPTNTIITSELLSNYKVLRITNYYPYNYTVTEGQAIFNWVNNGGMLLTDVHYNADINSVKLFGVDKIEGSGGGTTGLSWYFHGAPLVVTPVSGPFAVSSIGIEGMDKPYLQLNHGFNIDATYSGYPVVIHKSVGNGKVVITFDSGSYSLDVVHPGNAYRSCITMNNNLQFVKNVIQYLK
jgi:hypothetical protein